MLLNSLLLVLLLFLFYQDMRYRAVYWILFPSLLIVVIILSVRSLGIVSVLLNTVYNLGFIFIQLFLVSLYFSLKEKKLVNITREHLGWGDVLFLLCVSFYFSPANYVIFYISSLFLIALTALLLVRGNSRKVLKVPLAGLQSLFFMLLWLADWFIASFSLVNDDWLLLYFKL